MEGFLVVPRVSGEVLRLVLLLGIELDQASRCGASVSKTKFRSGLTRHNPSSQCC